MSRQKTSEPQPPNYGVRILSIPVEDRIPVALVGESVPLEGTAIVDRITAAIRAELSRPPKSQGTRKKARRRQATPREEAIIQLEFLRGLDYFRGLDSLGQKIPLRWLEDGCPPTHIKAYREAKWRQRIQSEKSDILRKRRPHLILHSVTRVAE